MTKLEKARQDYPIFDEFCVDYLTDDKEDDELEWFLEHISQWSNDLSKWKYDDFQEHWNSWI